MGMEEPERVASDVPAHLSQHRCEGGSAFGVRCFHSRKWHSNTRTLCPQRIIKVLVYNITPAGHAFKVLS